MLRTPHSEGYGVAAPRNMFLSKAHLALVRGMVPVVDSCAHITTIVEATSWNPPTVRQRFPDAFPSNEIATVILAGQESDKRS